MPSTSSNSTPPPKDNYQVYDKSEPGRGFVIVIYGLYIASIIAVVTAPLGALMAWMRLGRGAPWLDTHLRFQLRTFWLGLLAAIAALLLWRVTGMMALAPVYAWTFGYLFFSVGLIWMVARCAVGVHRLTSNRAIDVPRSLLFGLSRQP